VTPNVYIEEQCCRGVCVNTTSMDCVRTRKSKESPTVWAIEASALTVPQAVRYGTRRNSFAVLPLGCRGF